MTATIMIMLSNQNLILKGINPETNLKVFILRMALSTWILTEAILRDFVTTFFAQTLSMAECWDVKGALSSQQ